jgi:hypothetical protein
LATTREPARRWALRRTGDPGLRRRSSIKDTPDPIAEASRSYATPRLVPFQ